MPGRRRAGDDATGLLAGVVAAGRTGDREGEALRSPFGALLWHATRSAPATTTIASRHGPRRRPVMRADR
ncbi:MAG TPA: hypothetical protein VF053_18510 [Streptosporangiales bacterium]